MGSLKGKGYKSGRYGKLLPWITKHMRLHGYTTFTQWACAAAKAFMRPDYPQVDDVVVPISKLGEGRERTMTFKRSRARSKYGNKITVVDGITFHSAREANRYIQLRMLEHSGEIADLKLQTRHPLVTIDAEGNAVRVAYYVDDFNYREDGVWIVEDVKGHQTQVFKLKKRWFEAQYGMKIRLT